MIMMTRKKMRSRLSFPNHEQKTTAFPLAGRHLLEVENCKIFSFFLLFSSPLNFVHSHWHNFFPTGWMEGTYWLDAPKKSFIYIYLSLFPLSLSQWPEKRIILILSTKITIFDKHFSYQFLLAVEAIMAGSCLSLFHFHFYNDRRYNINYQAKSNIQNIWL